ncbi:MAG: NADH:flavin oxidoreductase/NADH oxidase family protein [Leptospira sp.]|nr:NADH:flavin oxidoreductase/NADH oxidase family protein [Leptospira sp.]
MKTSPMFTPITLPNGSELPNRLVKAAMEENLSDENLLPDSKLWNLYGAWSRGGVGLMITGNVMVDRFAMTGPGGVALEKDTDLAPFRTWANIAKSNGGKIWVQINHPGRQILAKLGGEVLAPSAIQVNLGKLSKLMGIPKELNEEKIKELIQRFGITAKQAESAGFDGVEIHAAHGYLISQFLSPLTNQRNDNWGGSLKNRSRFLVEIIQEVRKNVSPKFCVGVKLNSSDFQKGGFSFEDAKEVVSTIQTLGVDLIELSGGSYESPAMQGVTGDGSTLAREAYFIDFAREIVAISKVPILVTGGIKKRETAELVLESGIPLVGMATALAIDPELPKKWMSGQQTSVGLNKPNWKSKTLAGLANMAMVKYQLNRMAENKKTDLNVSPFFRLVFDQIRTNKLVKRYRKFMMSHK